MRPLVPLVLMIALVAGAMTPAARSRATPAQTPPDPATLSIRFDLVVGGLSNPVAIAHAGDGTGRLFIIEKVGRIRVFQDGRLLAQPFLDIRDRVESAANERGLLGLAFHPHYHANGYLFVGYTTSQPDRIGARAVGAVVYARYKVTEDPNRADPDSEKVLLWWEHSRGNHNGGHLAFGPRDGYLYIGTGDGGGGGDPDENGQNPMTYLGKMLRIDVDGGDPYAIPPGNPFAERAGARDELWALGLRNPWRYHFDRATGDLYIGDVGQNAIEEIDFQPFDSAGGENYGWDLMEGTRCYEPSSNCDRTGLTLPVAEYDHSQGCSVTGGTVYRGQRYPALVGTYFYTDYCSGRTWAMNRDAGSWRSAQISQVNLRIQSYGEDEAGEVYVAAGNGQILRLVDASAGAPTGTTPPGPSATPVRPTDTPARPTATRTPQVEPSPTRPPATATSPPMICTCLTFLPWAQR
jgi:glucose/arabinose dehydrogenase